MPHGKALNGHASIGPIKTLERLASAHEEHARAIRHTIGLLVESQSAGKRKATATILDGALALDAERIEATRPKGKRDGSFIAAKRAKRRETAGVLASLDAKTPRPITGQGKVSALLQNGYVKRKGAGYVRTSKPFVVGDEA